LVFQLPPPVIASVPKPSIFLAVITPIDDDIFVSGVHRLRKQAEDLDLDVVICVHNALEDVRACLDSVQTALPGRGKLYLIDDASDTPTAEFLASRSLEMGALLVRLDSRAYYTVAANIGVRSGSGRNVLLLNSDTVVPPLAFDKLSAALDREPRLGIVGPLSNAASYQSVPSTLGTASQTAINPLPAGMSVSEMDFFLEQSWNGLVARTKLVHGFCFGVKRAVFEKIGLFDKENFPKGYGEENDFCFRAADAGFELGVLTSTYVFHAKSRSYNAAEREPLMADAAAALQRKAGSDRVARAVDAMQFHPALIAARDSVAPLFAASCS
jgi:GT2 family glycosyltransferase